MKISLHKVPFLFDFIFLIVTVIQAIVILVMNLQVSTFFEIYADVMAKVWWLGLIAIVLHIIAYLIALDRNLVLFANLVAIVGYIILILLPSWLFIALPMLLVGVIIAFHFYHLAQIN